MAKMTAESQDGKALLQTLSTVEVGGEVELPSIFPGLVGSKTHALCVDKTEKFWQFQLSVLGVDFAQVVCEVQGKNIVLEEV